MTTYITRRLIHGFVVLFAVTVFVFLGMRLLPGDPIMLFVSESQFQQMSEQQLNELREQYGLNDSYWVQYADWVGGLFHGDMGVPYSYPGATVSQLISSTLPRTLNLTVIAAILSTFLGILAGLICALRRGGAMDTAVTSLANFGISLPEFWLGIMLIYLIGLKAGWLPTLGYTSPFKDFAMNIKQLIMPVICLTVITLAGVTRLTRSSMLEVIRQDYIRTAWSKGLKERVIVTRHILKNGLIPVITIVGMHIPLMIGGSVIIERVFNIPGMGRLMIEAVFQQDYQIVQGGTLVIAAVVVLVNILVDISYGWLDPRIRYA